MPWPCEFVQSKRKFACNARLLFCKDGAICAKNSPKRTSHWVALAIVKGTSLRYPSPIMAPGSIELVSIVIGNGHHPRRH